jgi:hypothetical protein
MVSLSRGEDKSTQHEGRRGEIKRETERARKV